MVIESSTDGLPHFVNGLPGGRTRFRLRFSIRQQISARFSFPSVHPTWLYPKWIACLLGMQMVSESN